MAGLLIALFLLLSFEQSGPPASPPAVAVNGHGLAVVGEPGGYRRLALADHRDYLVDLARFVPGLRVDLAYARRDNSVGRRLYGVARAYATLETAEALRAAQRHLRRRGLGLKVWDAYRPYRATLALWRAVHDPRFAAPPWSGSLHNRGAALDLTLVRADRRSLVMPTAFDCFGPRAGRAYPELPPAVIRRRDLLRETLERHGFVSLPTEWWHFERPGGGTRHPLDVAIGRLPAVPLPRQVWARYPPFARLLLLVDRWGGAWGR